MVAVLTGYLLARRKDWRATVLPAAALAGANTRYHVVKPLVARERPPEVLHLIAVSGRAFP